MMRGKLANGAPTNVYLRLRCVELGVMFWGMNGDDNTDNMGH